ncbi:MAG: ATP-dependent 6-phosphofructokinase [PVC group bacterium]|nr:ATP-dependent 6-phosphofructokinase [PVC group bacterium]
MRKKKRVGILTAGGDCPGLNGVIRAVAKKLIIEQNAEIIGIKDGYEGIINNKYKTLSYRDVSGILTLGGTILGTSNIANPYKYAVKEKGKLKFKDMSKKVIQNVKRLKLDCLVCIGGDGTLAIASKLAKDGIPVIGVPKTIDNDIKGTDVTFGFNSAVTIATEAIDRIHTTAESHHRVMVVEVMGRTAGWIALYAGIAGGGDIILLPEMPYDINGIAEVVKERNRRGKKFSIIVISEGAKPKGGKVVVQKMVKESTIQARLGGISFMLVDQLEKITGLGSRAVVLGHLQRGGSPTPFDRILATRLGTKAADMIKRRKFGSMVAVKGDSLKEISLQKVATGARTVPRNHSMIQAGRSVGTYFGD